MERLQDEQRFFRRMHWIKSSLQIFAGATAATLLPAPTTSLGWWLFFAILFCLSQFVGEVVIAAGYRSWRKSFGHRYPP